jgi:hypothetical protein
VSASGLKAVVEAAEDMTAVWNRETAREREEEEEEEENDLKRSFACMPAYM